MKVLKLLLFLIFSATSCFAAETVKFKDWEVGAGDGFVYAGTMNKNNNLLGQFCYGEDEGCYYIVTFDAACNPGDTYPVLINSNLGASSKQVVCDTELSEQGLYKYYIAYEEIDDLVQTAKSIGFAIPMQSDQFKAVRFSLDGASDAIDFMHNVVEQATEPPAEEEKKDSITF